MQSNRIYKVAKWLIAVTAYAFLAYKLATFDNYAIVADLYRSITPTRYLWLAAVLLLLPLNLWLESEKWRVLIQQLYPISHIESLYTVLWGQTGAFWTPNRIGEYPTRVLALPEGKRVAATMMGFVGSFAQTIIISACGVVACGLLLNRYVLPDYDHINALIPIVSVLAGVMLVIYFCLPLLGPILIRKPCTKNLGTALTNFVPKVSLPVLLLSALRYTIFTLQYYCMFRFCMVDVTLQQALVAIPTIYLFISYTPSINISEAAIRGSYASMVIGCFSTNLPGAVCAGIFIWAVNTCLPVLIGTLLAKKEVRNIRHGDKH